MIEAVIFDFDGTIVDTESVWTGVYTELLRERGTSLPEEVLQSIIGTNNDAMDQYLLQTFGDPGVIAELHREARLRYDRRMEQPVMREGVADYLRDAKGMGLKIGLASSSTRDWIDAYIWPLGIGQYFEAIVTADDVERIKPHPDLYIEALRRLKAEPDRSLAFEDSVNGLIAARSAGMHCVIVPNEATKKMPFRDFTLRLDSMADMSLEDVIRAVARRAEENEES
jgi:putative hydrolase of the HAD superfamily